MVPQLKTTAENGHNTKWNEYDGTNTAWQKKCKLDLLKDKCHWCYPPNLHQLALMGRACLMAERQQVDQTCDSGLGVIQKDVGGMTLSKKSN